MNIDTKAVVEIPALELDYARFALAHNKPWSRKRMIECLDRWLAALPSTQQEEQK